MDHREHVFVKSGMYVGSTEKDPIDVWLVNDEGTKMIKKRIDFVPALFKIYDEIIANAIDHYIKQNERKAKGENVNLVKNIKVTIEKETGIITVYNDGDGIDIVKHEEHGIYVPELIFGHLLTSTNYDETQERTSIGTNGIGGKATNIFSKWFEIETLDLQRMLIYKQRFENNMKDIKSPSVRKATAKKPYTSVRFLPDFKRFGLENLSDDMYEVMRKRVYDACAVTDKDVSIHFNGIKLDIHTFDKYVDMYIGSKAEHTRVAEKINDRWDIVASYNDNSGFEQISFVNGLLTLKGGKHVDYIVTQIVKKITDLVAKKHKTVTIRPQNIKDNMILFLKCTIINPTFDSQTKETLTTVMSKFGSKAEVSDAFALKLFKTMEEKLLTISAMQDDKTMKKTDGKKSTTIRGIPKLEDASWAGTARSKDCILILTEGDSAASMALAGLSEVGRDRYGVFPLKGKVLNVLDTAVKKIADNEEITNIKKVLGLETGKIYTNTNDLRYGKIMLMVDQDLDGSHIKGLIFNLFHSMWPGLIKSPGISFMTSMLTPIVKVRPSRASDKSEVMLFYTLTDYENWKKKEEQAHTLAHWKIKYFKGLGSSTNLEAKDYFKTMQLVNYKFSGKASTDGFDLAFNKKKADDRKVWLGKYDRQDVLDYKDTEVKYEDFVNKELRPFSIYDLARSVPCMCDGFKPSHRKIVYSCFKKNLITDEIRVAQLAGYVSETSGYHHGEASLQQAIIGLAQNYVGSNNINILEPNGQFGCLDPETLVLMWDSSCKAAKDIVVGDNLVGDDGAKRTVLRTVSGTDQMYRIKMMNGESYTVNSEHILTLTTCNNEVYDIKLTDFLRLHKDQQEGLYCIKNTEPVRWEHKDVLIDPFEFGNSGQLKEPGTFIIDYIINDVATRKQFLAGLLHSCDQNSAFRIRGIESRCLDIHASYHSLIITLANSLGYRTFIDLMTPNAIHIIEFKERNNMYTFVVEPVGLGPFNGWSVDGNERFLLGDWTVTHNSRVHGGKDASQPRYIHTLLSPLAQAIYMKDDAEILTYIDDDGILVEPLYYIPIIPMILVNGALGIGTGFSTNIPCYNPKDLVAILKAKLEGRASPIKTLFPWYQGFKGQIKEIDGSPGKYVSIGKWEAGKSERSEKSEATIVITELPIGTWTFDYKEDLEALLDKNEDFKKYENKSGETIQIHLHFSSASVRNSYLTVEKNGFTKLENTFKLVSPKGLTTSNMFAFNSNGQITKYESAMAILEDFYVVRKEYYGKRKDSLLAKYAHTASFLDNKRRFIKAVVTETIKVHHLSKDELESYLSGSKPSYDLHNNTYDYITRIPVYNFTKDKVEELDQEIKQAKGNIKALEAKTVESMWLADLETLEKNKEWVSIK